MENDPSTSCRRSIRQRIVSLGERVLGPSIEDYPTEPNSPASEALAVEATSSAATAQQAKTDQDYRLAQALALLDAFKIF